MWGRRTVIVDEVCDAYAKERRVEARVQACDAFSMYYSPYGIVGG